MEIQPFPKGKYRFLRSLRDAVRPASDRRGTLGESPGIPRGLRKRSNSRNGSKVENKPLLKGNGRFLRSPVVQDRPSGGRRSTPGQSPGVRRGPAKPRNSINAQNIETQSFRKGKYRFGGSPRAAFRPASDRRGTLGTSPGISRALRQRSNSRNGSKVENQ